MRTRSRRVSWGNARVRHDGTPRALTGMPRYRPDPTPAGAGGGRGAQSAAARPERRGRRALRCDGAESRRDSGRGLARGVGAVDACMKRWRAAPARTRTERGGAARPRRRAGRRARRDGCRGDGSASATRRRAKARRRRGRSRGGRHASLCPGRGGTRSRCNAPGACRRSARGRARPWPRPTAGRPAPERASRRRRSRSESRSAARGGGARRARAPRRCEGGCVPPPRGDEVGTMTAPWAKMLSVSCGMLSLSVRYGRPYRRSARTPAAGPAGVETDERSEAGLEAADRKGDRRRSAGPRVGREEKRRGPTQNGISSSRSEGAGRRRPASPSRSRAPGRPPSRRRCRSRRWAG